MTSVAQVMTRDAATIGPSQSIQQAAKMMDELNVGSLPVCDGEHLVGMVTDRDIVVRAISAGMLPESPIEDIVSGPANWCFEDEDVEIARKKMEDAQIRRLPVVDRDKHLVGIIALGDLATTADGGTSSTLAAVSTPSTPDR
ncbi:CBS domain-containing protein [Paraburkholderia dilworthii]|uniref:CBS domain-containing protein n=1 Tax=Paraburkholderia dilworthii TaxID=948106 RepID=UPI00042264DD|nr:CBS domain-containing protein [Paraburkholderia dilworthii]